MSIMKGQHTCPTRHCIKIAVLSSMANNRENGSLAQSFVLHFFDLGHMTLNNMSPFFHQNTMIATEEVVCALRSVWLALYRQWVLQGECCNGNAWSKDSTGSHCMGADRHWLLYAINLLRRPPHSEATQQVSHNVRLDTRSYLGSACSNMCLWDNPPSPRPRLMTKAFAGPCMRGPLSQCSLLGQVIVHPATFSYPILMRQNTKDSPGKPHMSRPWPSEQHRVESLLLLLPIGGARHGVKTTKGMEEGAYLRGPALCNLHFGSDVGSASHSDYFPLGAKTAIPGVGASGDLSDPSAINVLKGGVDFSQLVLDLDQLRTFIQNLDEGGWTPCKVTESYMDHVAGRKDPIVEGFDHCDYNSDGIAVIDIDCEDSDFQLTNTDWIINGDGRVLVLFRIRGRTNMVMTDTAILLGDGGIGGARRSSSAVFCGAVREGPGS